MSNSRDLLRTRINSSTETIRRVSEGLTNENPRNLQMDIPMRMLDFRTHRGAVNLRVLLMEKSALQSSVTSINLRIDISTFNVSTTEGLVDKTLRVRLPTRISRIETPKQLNTDPISQTIHCQIIHRSTVLCGTSSQSENQKRSEQSPQSRRKPHKTW